jgi:hypothetical protein
MKLELALLAGKNFPQIDEPLKYTEVRIWNCKFTTLDPLKQFQNLERLEIFVFPDETLEILGNLIQLQSLKVTHFPRVNDLTPLSHLPVLEELELSPSPGSYKKQHVKTLAPLKKLTHLKKISLRGIMVDDGSLEPLGSCPSLIEFVSGNLFSTKQFATLKAKMPNLQGSFLTPLVNVPYNYCSKCGSQKVFLSGKMKRSMKCPKCDQAKVTLHIQEWKSYQQESRL